MGVSRPAVIVKQRLEARAAHRVDVDISRTEDAVIWRIVDSLA